MTEVSFAKSFLGALDGRPTKISADHVEDPKKFPARGAVILPKQPKSMSKPTDLSSSSVSGPGSEPSVSVVVRSVKTSNPGVPALDSGAAVTLSSLDPSTTSVLDVKAALASKLSGIPADRLRLLHRKKPVPDSKVLRDLLAASEDKSSTVEMSVMILGGGAPAPAAAASPATPETGAVAQGPSGGEVLQSSEFWDDLRGFLLQRIRDEKMAGDLTDTFQAAWKAKG